MEKIHVLLVEDELTLAMIIKDTLEEQEFIITTASDGEEGLRTFFAQKPDIVVYNPQNEMFRLLGTKRSFSQNETFFFSHPYPALFRLISHF